MDSLLGGHSIILDHCHLRLSKRDFIVHPNPTHIDIGIWRCCLQALLDHSNSKDLLDISDRYDNTPLHIAAQKGYVNCVKVNIYSLSQPEKLKQTKTNKTKLQINRTTCRARPHGLDNIIMRKNVKKKKKKEKKKQSCLNNTLSKDKKMPNVV